VGHLHLLELLAVFIPVDCHLEASTGFEYRTLASGLVLGVILDLRSAHSA